MIVFNTTFHIEEDVHEEFIEYMLQSFIPMSTRSGLLKSPRLARVHGNEEEQGISFAMEFQVDSLFTLERWNKEESELVYSPLLVKFKEKLAGFSTVMEMISY